LLTVFDPEQGKEENAVSSVMEFIQSGSIQSAIIQISSSSMMMYGIDASQLSLDAGYKLQILSSSHVPTDGLNPYSPNTLLKNRHDIEDFLKFGIDLAMNDNNDNDGIGIIFCYYLFVTRGLDLAIPSRKAYLNLTGHGNDNVLHIEKYGIPYLNCPSSLSTSGDDATIRFYDNNNKIYVSNGNNDIYNDNDNTNDEFIEISCFGTKVSINKKSASSRRHVDSNDTTMELWYSHENILLSEAACLKCTKHVMSNDHNQVTTTSNAQVCATRILLNIKLTLPSSKPTTFNNTTSNSGSKLRRRRPNLLAIELRGVSQKMLHEYMPRLKSISKIHLFQIM
jgi:hypothetical protein